MNLAKNGNKKNGNNKPLNKPTNQTNKRNTSPSNGEPTLTDKITEATKKTTNAASELGEKINKTAQDISENVKGKIENVKGKLSEAAATPTGQEASKAVGQVQEFMQANSAISKFVAVILSILVFYILFNIGVHFLSQYFMPTTKAKVIDGLIPSNTQIIVSANPNIKNSVPILRSVNKNQGLEYTWNVWFLIKDVSNLNGYGLIFSKGQAKSTTIPMENSLLGVCPGVYINKNPEKNQVEMVVGITTMIDPSLNNTGIETMTVPDIPLNKWVHCAVRVQSLSVDVYINGVMKQRKNMKSLPNQNYYDTYVGDSTSFNGFISSLNYYAYALNYDQIQSDYVKGPNMKLIGQNTKINYKDYLAMNWYYKSV